MNVSYNKFRKIVTELKLIKFLSNHLEIPVLGGGLILLAFMDPAVNSLSFCLFDLTGFDFCPGKGLGHSIAYTLNGDFNEALNAHFMGPAAIVIIITRIVFLIYKQFLTLSTGKDG